MYTSIYIYIYCREGFFPGGAAPPGPPATQSVSWLVDIHIMCVCVGGGGGGKIKNPQNY